MPPGDAGLVNTPGLRPARVMSLPSPGSRAVARVSIDGYDRRGTAPRRALPLMSRRGRRRRYQDFKIAVAPLSAPRLFCASSRSLGDTAQDICWAHFRRRWLPLSMFNFQPCPSVPDIHARARSPLLRHAVDLPAGRWLNECRALDSSIMLAWPRVVEARRASVRRLCNLSLFHFRAAGISVAATLLRAMPRFYIF